jgi:hypothetical protein
VNVHTGDHKSSLSDNHCKYGDYIAFDSNLLENITRVMKKDARGDVPNGSSE